MTSVTTQAKIGYFGKIPSRGDFIKASDNFLLSEMLDKWLTQTIALLSEDPRWKINYDETKPIDFAFIGPRKKLAVAGHIIASKDMAQRRFPFITMTAIEVENPVDLVKFSPQIFSGIWTHLATQGQGVVDAEDPTATLQDLTLTPIDIKLNGDAFQAEFTEFLETHTMGMLDLLLLEAGFKASASQLILALGLLLQPVMTSTTSRLEKSLVLPVPNDAKYCNLISTFWMHLITPFLLRADFELALFFHPIQQSPSMVLGFSGASPQALLAIFDQQLGNDQQITFADTQWVDQQINTDYGFKKLSSYLVQPDFTLKSALDSFCSTFIGT